MQPFGPQNEFGMIASHKALALNHNMCHYVAQEREQRWCLQRGPAMYGVEFGASQLAFWWVVETVQHIAGPMQTKKEYGSCPPNHFLEVFLKMLIVKPQLWRYDSDYELNTEQSMIQQCLWPCIWITSLKVGTRLPSSPRTTYAWPLRRGYSGTVAPTIFATRKWSGPFFFYSFWLVGLFLHVFKLIFKSQPFWANAHPFRLILLHAFRILTSFDIQGFMSSRAAYSKLYHVERSACWN
jgi:hypothetical protein